MNKLFKSISLITLTLILTLGLFGCGKKTISNVNSNVNQNQNVNVATSTSEIDMSNWKTYRNKEFGFEFKYPNTWVYKIYDMEKNCIILENFTQNKHKIDRYTESLMGSIDFCYHNESNLKSFMIKNSYDLTDVVFEEQNSSWKNINKNTIKITKFKDYDAYIVMPEEAGVSIYFTDNKKIYSINALWHSNEVSKEEIDAIIESILII